MASWCIAIRLASARLIQQCKEVTQYGKGCAYTTDAFSSFMNILIGWNVRLGRFHSPKSRRAKKSSKKLNARLLQIRCETARISDSRSRAERRSHRAWIRDSTRAGRH